MVLHVSQLIKFDIARASAPHDVVDRLERSTWAAFSLYVANQCVTEHRKRNDATVFRAIQIPMFPIAEWIVQNWWSLLYEPCRGEAPPKENSGWSIGTRQWLARHCIRAADSALVLPYFHLFSVGNQLSAVWYEDDEGGTNSQYLTYGFQLLDRSNAETALRGFVFEVLDWCAGENDDRVTSLRREWDAIRSADQDEREFCEAAGRMGLDPYCVDEWPAYLAEFLTDTIGARIREPLVEDLLEATEPDKAPSLWEWVNNSQHLYGLSSRAPQLQDLPRALRGKDYGYRIAHNIRELAGIPSGSAIEDLVAFARKLDGISLSLEQHNSIPSSKVSAIVGWNDQANARIAGPLPAREDSRRFLMARGLFQALTGCTNGARLLTKAFTWDQQAGRAFAAELLAPRDALAEYADADMELDERSELQKKLANKYNVSTQLIGHQLQNHGIWS